MAISVISIMDPIIKEDEVESSEEDKDTKADPETTKEDNGEGDPSDEGGDDNGEGGEATQTIKVGDKEYTADQIKELETKGKSYDSLLPDYTKKSQKLSDLETKGQEKEDELEEKPPYHDPEWKPKDYNELRNAIKMAEKAGEKNALKALEKIEKNRTDYKAQVDDFITDIKSKDAEFDEKDFYDFISKHGIVVNSIKELEPIYSVYKDSVKVTTKPPIEKDNIERKDKVAGKPSGGTVKPFTYPSSKIRSSGSPSEAIDNYLQDNKL